MQRGDEDAEVFRDVGEWGSFAKIFFAEAILLSDMRRLRPGRRPWARAAARVRSTVLAFYLREGCVPRLCHAFLNVLER